MSIFNMIDTLRRRPGMYLGKNSISALRHFLDGYRAAEREYGTSTSTGELFPLPFWYMHEYTGYRLNERNSMGWSLMLLQACNGSEEDALWKFFEFYDDFRQVGMKRYWKAVLSEENIAWNNQFKGGAHYCGPLNGDIGSYTKEKYPAFWEPIYRDPLAVYVIELTIPACLFAVETADAVNADLNFFPSHAKAMESAERRFGSIDSWKEADRQTISFGKNIIV